LHRAWANLILFLIQVLTGTSFSPLSTRARRL